MKTPRRIKIESLLAEEPDDVFLRYSLALEMEAAGEWEAGLDILQELAQATPPYVPAYHMAARHLLAHGRVEDSRRALRDGIEAARAEGNTHAAGEMAELLMSLGNG